MTGLLRACCSKWSSGSWTKPAEARVLLTKTFKTGQPVPWRFKPGTVATITWIEVVSPPHAAEMEYRPVDRENHGLQ